MIYTGAEETFIVPVYIRGTGSADYDHFEDARKAMPGQTCEHNNVMIKYKYRASEDDEFSEIVFNPADQATYFANQQSMMEHYAEITAPYLYYASGTYAGRTIAYVETHAIQQQS